MIISDPAGAGPVPFATQLARFGDRPALLTADGDLTYTELAGRVDELARRFGDERRLVLVAAANDVDSIVAYLAALAGGHAALLMSGSDAVRVDRMIQAYDPDLVVGRIEGSWHLEERRSGTAHDLHPELALLLSTSGSTGSPKLVRLSHENLESNADAIAQYLGIRGADRAATTLPMQYSYGLSVINSHLLRGAGLVVTDLSVVDRCFWELARDKQVSTFAGVPYTFDLLDAVGFAEMSLPDLRVVTQAGGRLAADRVTRFAELGRMSGWELVVMYGQTEATARMAYLPPGLAATRPTSIGQAIPGGSFRLVPVDGQPDPDVGELVYSGPNVMLGYAEHPADLRLGRVVDELWTGDLARCGADGLYEIVGRSARFAKIVGLRVDLERVEAMLDEHDITAFCADGDSRLVIATEDRADELRVQQLCAHEFGLPARAVAVLPVEAMPRTSSGKPDYAALLALCDAADAADAAVVEQTGATTGPLDADALRDVYAVALNRPDASLDSTFVGLGGDSLSYVELSLAVEESLGHLPPDWHITSIRDLAAARAKRRVRGWRTVEMGVALRAASILAIIATHCGLLTVRGGGHILIAVAGLNFARFQLTTAPRVDRVRHLLGSAARIAIPSVVAVAVGFGLAGGAYGWPNLFLLNSVLGPHTSAPWLPDMRFWFIEALLYILLILAALLAIPWFDRMERRHALGVAAVFLAIGLGLRFGADAVNPVTAFLTAPGVFWIFAFGWALARTTRTWQRLLLSAVVFVALPGYFSALSTGRPLAVGLGLLLLVWIPTVPCPTVLARAAGVLASASLYLYVSHWIVLDLLDQRPPVLDDPGDHAWAKLVVSLAVGIGYWLVFTRVFSWWGSARSTRRAGSGAALGAEERGEPARAEVRTRTR